MNSIFWIGIGIGAVLSLIASIAANLAHPRITGYFEKRSLVSHEKRKRRALRLHTIITEIHGGKRDKYLYVLYQTAGLIIAATLFVTALCSMLVLAAISPFYVDLEKPFFHDSTDAMLFSFAVLSILIGFGAMVTSIVANELKTVLSAVDDHPKYIADFDKQWGQSDAQQ
jgi:hypothetical protein